MLENRVRLNGLAVLLAAMLAVTGCSGGDEASPEPTRGARTGAPAGTEPNNSSGDAPSEGGAAGGNGQEERSGMSAVRAGAALKRSDRVRRLSELVRQAELLETLNGEGPFTIFAPVNKAFQPLGQEGLEQLRNDPAALRELLSYHVHEGDAFEAGQLPTEIETMGGTVSISEDKMELNGGQARIVRSDIKVQNGVIHLIDGVLMPAQGPEGEG